MTNRTRKRIINVLCACIAGCQSNTRPRQQYAISDSGEAKALGIIRDVKTTAYTHTESDHIAYGAKTAAGGKLIYGNVRSAAADWSVYPVGTIFQIEGDTHLYEVDDYGSALVGTKTIDLYKPTKVAMNDYGARNVNIKVVKWGSFRDSLTIMKPRENAKPHVHQMVTSIEKSKN